MQVIDLFSGLGGWSAAFRDRGHEVFTVDIDPRFEPDLVGDILEITHADIPRTPDVVLASPPCVEFSRDIMPWCNSDGEPSMTLVRGTITLIKQLEPRYWVLENVRGAIRWLKPEMGNYTKRVGSRYLWGKFPIFDCPHYNGKENIPPGPDRAALRAKIPYGLSEVLCIAIERELESDSENGPE